MKIKPKKITAQDYLTKVMKQRRAIHMSNQAIAKLEARWIADYCPVTVGTDMKLTGDQDGYTSFLITRIHVDIEDAQGEGSKENSFSIQFSFTGKYRGEGLEDKVGRTRFNLVSDEPKS